MRRGEKPFKCTDCDFKCYKCDYSSLGASTLVKYSSLVYIITLSSIVYIITFISLVYIVTFIDYTVSLALSLHILYHTDEKLQLCSENIIRINEINTMPHSGEKTEISNCAGDYRENVVNILYSSRR